MNGKAGSDIDVLVVGAGVVGLAAARAFARGGREVVVAERGRAIGHETSSRNSEVIHAGIYYPSGSVKARACVEGRSMLYDYCAANGVPHRRIGKLIVATSEDEVPKLDAIRVNAGLNGVDLAPLTRAEAERMEPALHAYAALHSPETGIVDSHALMQALEGEIDTHGGQVVLGTEVTSVATGRATLADGTSLTANRIVVCGGLAADRLLPGAPHSKKGWATRYAKGNYFRLAEGRAPFERLIYPVPEPGGLGTHLTLDLAGAARFGPDVEWVDEIDYRVDPARAPLFERSVRRFWPDLPEGALVPDYAGIRPKIEGGDFRRLTEADHGLGGVDALVGIESPGLTACLWLGEWVAA